MAVKEAAPALSLHLVACSTTQPTKGHATSVSSLPATFEDCADMRAMEQNATHRLCAHVGLGQSLWPTTPGEAVWHAQVRQRLSIGHHSSAPLITTDSQFDTFDFLSKLTSTSKISALSVENHLAVVALEVNQVPQNLGRTTLGEAIWHAQVRQSRVTPFDVWAQKTTQMYSHASESLSEVVADSSVCPLPCEAKVPMEAIDVTADEFQSSRLKSSSSIGSLPPEDDLAFVAQEIPAVTQNLFPTSPAELVGHANLSRIRGRPFSLWPQVQRFIQAHACDSAPKIMPESIVCPLPSESTESTVATDVIPPISQWMQRRPPALPDNRFAQDRTQRTYVCDNCHKSVAWRSQAKGFDGQYWAYNNNLPVASLQKAWERGEDFRWYCTACYASWWNMSDWMEVREALHLEHKSKKRQLRAEHWRKHKEVCRRE